MGTGLGRVHDLGGRGSPSSHLLSSSHLACPNCLWVVVEYMAVINVQEIARRTASRSVSGDPMFAPDDPHQIDPVTWNDIMNACMVELAIAMLECKDE